ncbi:TetR/AcrR family transcriptional regulator [Geomicrobium sp. JCM 19039]|uniref:TetR/AcrR family transcriptional regulator n=1 Tax=Geomicrobium sp. JCM 19039 TaxID=1460636 RepID=UPI00045F3BB6|nr:TetR/AcrR family transcriptional regulator [Geomicrobium sp. JCM 19039]GAK10406.1 hypothetical protein JCM19039_14 [Geomicrobium sp. JCM 19039]
MTKELNDAIYVTIIGVIAENGIRFTTEQVARALGTSKRTVYEYFSSKEELLSRTIDFVFRDIQAIDRTIVNDHTLSEAEKMERVFASLPVNYDVGIIIQHADELEKKYPALHEKVANQVSAVWKPFIELVEPKFPTAYVTVLKTLLEEMLLNFLDTQYLQQHNVTFEEGMEQLQAIVLQGILPSKT